MSALTFFIALCIIFSNSGEYVEPSTNISCKFHTLSCNLPDSLYNLQTLSKNLPQPRILSIDQGAVWSNGPINIS